MAKYQPPPAWRDYPIVERPAWKDYPIVELGPQADRDMKALQTERLKAYGSGEWDEGQLEEFDGHYDERAGNLWSHGADRKPPAAEQKLSDDFYNNTLTVEGPDGPVVYQPNPQTGTFEVLNEPSKDMAPMEEKELERKAKQDELKANYIQQQMTPAEGKTARSMKEVKAEAEEAFGDAPVDKARQEVISKLESIPDLPPQFLAQVQQGQQTEAEFESVADIMGRVRSYWDHKAGRFVVDPESAANARAEIADMEYRRQKYDAELKQAAVQKETLRKEARGERLAREHEHRSNVFDLNKQRRARTRAEDMTRNVRELQERDKERAKRKAYLDELRGSAIAIMKERNSQLFPQQIQAGQGMTFDQAMEETLRRRRAVLNATQPIPAGLPPGSSWWDNETILLPNGQKARYRGG